MKNRMKFAAAARRADEERRGGLLLRRGALLALFLAAGMLMMAACERDEVEPATPQQQEEPQPDPNLQLAGTSWCSQIETDYSYYGISLHITYYSFIDFLDAEHGEQFDDITVRYPAYFQMDDERTTMTTHFTYTTTADGGTMYVVEDVLGEHYEYESAFEIDTVAGTLSTAVDDSDMEEMLGIKTMVYEKIR